ncbi:hypothetical protein V8J82_23420 [Gymnodinialimonas sp. 2305UL16-5]|uniref:hypothetical protein n=1 Tax=Gymnodinialimonas mytili TaxID=3126503 RepID=UPI0030AE478B
MRNVRFFGFEGGSEVTVGVSSGPISRGPLTISAWQQAVAVDGPDIGQMTIGVTRAPNAAAPELVWFEAQVSSSTGLPSRVSGDVGTATYGIYDQQFHELEFVWSLGDSGTWDTPLRVPDYLMSKNFAHGPTVAHAYDTPGDKTITCTAYRTTFDSTTETQDIEIVARKTITLANGNPAPLGPIRSFDEAFPPRQRVYFDPTGDYSDLGPEIAAGARTGNDLPANTLYQAVDATNRPGGPYAVLIKRGTTASFDGQNGLRMTATSHYIGTYGSGPRPVLESDILFGHNSDIAEADRGGFFTFTGLETRGGWDDVNERGTTGSAPFGLNSAMHMLIHDCLATGIANNCVTFTPSRTATKGQVSMAFINSEVRGFRNYGIFVSAAGSTDQALFSVRGSKISRTLGAAFGGHNKDRSHNAHTCIRCEQSNYTSIQASEFLSFSDWGSVTQPALRLNTNPAPNPSPDAPGDLPAKTYVYGNLIEGGGGSAISYATAGSAGYPLPANGRFMHNVLLGAWTNRGGIFSQNGGTTIQENIWIAPDVPHWNKGNQLPTQSTRGNDFIGIGAGVIRPNENDENYTEPVRIIGNVLIDLKTTSNEAEYIGISLGEEFAGFAENRDNYIYAPNRASPEPGIGPMDKVGDFVPLIRNPRWDTLGTRDPLAERNHVEYTGFAASLGDLPILRPAERTAPTGPLSRTDVFGRERPAQPTTGAIEPS